jgi:hypothetical protein
VGVVKFASNYVQQNLQATSLLTTSMAVSNEVDFPRAAVDLLGVPTSAFAIDAQAIMAITNPSTRTQAWLNAGFGHYVAFGYDLRGSIDLAISMKEQKSFKSCDSFFDASGTYKGVSSSVGIASQLKDTMEKNEIGYGMIATGCFVPLMPPLSQLQTVQGQWDFANYLNQEARNCKTPVGLYLISAGALPGGPVFNMPTWDDMVVEMVGECAEAAIDEFVRASRWNQSAGLRNYLDGHFRPVPNSTQSFTDGLDHVRIELSTSLNYLRDSIVYYGDPDHAGEAVALANVLAGMANVNQAAQTLNLLSWEIQTMIQALDPMLVTVTENHYPSGSGPGTAVYPTFTVTIDNCGFFRGFTDMEIEPWIGFWEANNFGTFHTMEIYEYLWDGTYCTRATSNGDISPIDLRSYQIHSSGPSAGLSRVQFQLVSKLRSTTQWIDLKFKDEFGRTVIKSHNMYD